MDVQHLLFVRYNFYIFYVGYVGEKDGCARMVEKACPSFRLGVSTSPVKIAS